MSRKIKSIILCIAALLLFSCKNGFDVESFESQEEKAQQTVSENKDENLCYLIVSLNSADSDARTIYEKSYSFDKIVLKGNGEILNTWQYSIREYNNKILLNAGIYTFTLEFYSEDNLFYSSIIEGKEIVTGENQLEFEAKRISDGTGNVNIDFSYRSYLSSEKLFLTSQISKVKAGIFDITGENSIPNYEEEELTSEDITRIVSYSKADVPDGSYLFKITFLDANDNVLKVYSDLLVVETHKAINKTIFLSDDFNFYFNVSYENLPEGVSWKENYTPVTLRKFSETLILPGDSDFVKPEGYVFVGWYEKEDYSGKAVSVINAESDIQDKTFYAKFSIFDVKKFSVSDFPGWSDTDHAVNAQILDKNPDLQALAELLKTATCPVFLDLSACTELTEIPQNCFKSIDKLAGITIPENVTVIQSDAFYECTSLSEVNFLAKNCNIASESYSSPFYKTGAFVLNIGESVTVINKKMFINSNVSTVNMVNGVTEIKESAFNYCTYLKSLTIAETVTKLGKLAFANCIALEEINFLAAECTIDDINKITEANCPFYQSGSYGKGFKLTIGDKVKFVEAYMFCGSGLSRMNINSELITEIRQYTFYGTDLNSVVIPETVTTLAPYAFGDISELKSISIPECITEIPVGAFYRCGFNELIIPDSITNIGAKAFMECTHLTKLTLPDNLKVIRNNAFMGCTGITKLNIPDSVTEIGSGAFKDCTTITELTLSNNLKAIAGNAFNHCIGITELNIPDSVTEIGGSAFMDCKKITELTFSNNLKSIGNYAFNECTGITEFNIPESVTEIGEYAFRGCTGITEVTIPSSVKKIGEYAFRGCTGITEVTIPSSVKKIGDYAFAACSALEKINYNVVSVSDCKNIFSDAGTKSENGLVLNLASDIQKIPEGFCNGAALTTLTIPESVTYMGDHAFNNCTKLNQVYFNAVECENASLYGVGNYEDGIELTFGEAVAKITMVVNNGRVTKVNFNAKNCADLTKNLFGTTKLNVVIGEQVERIPAYLFENITFKEQLDVPVSVKEVGGHAFYGCSGEDLFVKGELESIGSEAFRNCISLKEVNFSNTKFTTLGNYAFLNTGLASVTLPESLTSIGNSVFANCFSLEEINYNAKNCAPCDNSHALFIGSGSEKGIRINVGDKVERVVDYLCDGIESKVTEINFPEGKTVVVGSGAFRNCKNAVFTNGITVSDVGNYGFYKCGNLTSIAFDSSTKIGASAFAGCSELDQITVPETVTSIGHSAFKDCTSIKKIEFNAINCSDFSSEDTEHVFENIAANESSVTVKFGDNIERVPAYFCSAFNTKVSNITFPEGKTVVVGSGAFRNCKNAVFTNGITVSEVEDYGFYNCGHLASLKFESSTEIGVSAFEGCTSLTQIALPETLLKISIAAFKGCENLTEVNIPVNVTSLGVESFNDCTSLKSIEYSASNSTIEGNGKTNSTVFTSNAKVKLQVSFFKNSTSGGSIPEKLFMENEGLSSVEIYKNGTGGINIGEYAFKGCWNLVSVNVISDGTKATEISTIGQYAFAESALFYFTYDNDMNLYEIDHYAFKGCRYLHSFIIKETVCIFEFDAFNNCELSKFYIEKDATGYGFALYFTEGKKYTRICIIDNSNYNFSYYTKTLPYCKCRAKREKSNY